MPTQTTSRSLSAAILGAGALALGLVASPAAGESTTTVELSGGSTALHLDLRTARVLGSAGIDVRPVGPARAAGARVTFPVTGGTIDPSNAAGTVTHSGGLAFSAGPTTVRATDFTVSTTGPRPVLTARVGSARVPLVNLDLDDAVVIRRGPGNVQTWVVRVESTLHPVAARALSQAFGAPVPAGVRIGRVDIRTQPDQVILSGGATTLTLDPDAAAALTSLGVTPSPIAPGEPNRSGLAFPITGGKVAVGTFIGDIPHSGGIALTAGATRVELKNFIIEVSGTPRLTAQVGDTTTRVPLKLDLSDIRAGLSRRKAVVRDARVALSADAAAALNAAFGVTALTEDLPLGIADVRGTVR
ncbi:MAG: hypothetical protein RIB67_09485 [Miltoncostaeaceae bacterium]